MARVLIIDDCEELRMIVSDLLEDLGMEVVASDDLKQAWEHLDRGKFDLVLCDLVMPLEEGEEEGTASAMVGVHAIHELSKKFPKLPIVAISGELTGEPLRAIRQFGALTTLSKPFGREELKSAVEYALNREKEQANVN